MGTDANITGQAIAGALKAKAEAAYNEKVKEPFKVAGVQSHKASVVYTVKAEYDTKVQGTLVHYPAGEVYSRESCLAAIAKRGVQLLSNPGVQFRDHVLARLKSNPEFFKKNQNFVFLRDPQDFYCVEACPGCAGQGTNICGDCDGVTTVNCRQCYGMCNVTCTGCSGTGNTAHSSACGQCSGTGRYLGNQCGSCYGTGKPGQNCSRCYATGKMKCPGCNGTAQQNCSSCRNGKVTCGTCQGSCKVTYQYHLDVTAKTTVNYSWSGTKPEWLSKAIQDAVKNPVLESVFKVSSYDSESNDPYQFVGRGYVLGTEAKVSYRSQVGQCQFLGESMVPVYLDGLLSGNFDKVLKQMEDPSKLRSVRKAWKNTVASTLLREVCHQKVDLQLSTPVKTGVISLTQALSFFKGCKSIWEFIDSQSNKRTLRATARYSMFLFMWMALFYFIVNLLGVPHQPATQGVLALLTHPGEVISKLFLHYRIAIDNGGWTLWTFLAVSIPVGDRIVPLFSRNALDRVDNDWLRVPYLMVIRTLALSVMLALAPTTEFYFYPPDWIPNGARIGHAITATLLMTPSLLVTAFFFALLKHKDAGRYWAKWHNDRLKF